jgi:hypothetical protein
LAQLRSILGTSPEKELAASVAATGAAIVEALAQWQALLRAYAGFNAAMKEARATAHTWFEEHFTTAALGAEEDDPIALREASAATRKGATVGAKALGVALDTLQGLSCLMVAIPASSLAMILSPRQRDELKEFASRLATLAGKKVIEAATLGPILDMLELLDRPDDTAAAESANRLFADLRQVRERAKKWTEFAVAKEKGMRDLLDELNRVKKDLAVPGGES